MADVRRLAPRPVALLVPCYNAAAHVAPFLASLDTLDPGFDEVLFLDDGSTDGTAELLRASGRRVIARSVNAGSAAARNRLLAETDAPRVHFHDIDDPFLRRDFLALFEVRQPDDTVLFGRTRVVGPGTPARVMPVSPERLRRDPVRFVLNDVIHLNGAIWPRARLQAQGGFRPEFRTQQDIMLFIDWVAGGGRLEFVEDVVAQHVRHAASTLGRLAPSEHQRRSLAVCRRAAAVLPANRDAVGEKAAYHLRRLAQTGHLAEALTEVPALEAALGARVAPAGGRLERVLARVFGTSAALRYTAWRATLSLSARPAYANPRSGFGRHTQ